jgi:NADPH:quinone reductase-like Zn-dependent oxidoreductase
MMKAIVFTEYGSPDVLKFNQIEKPEPKDNEVLVRVHAVSVNYGDLIARNFANLTSREFNMPALLYIPARMEFGWNKPKITILGSEIAGQVEAMGAAVTRFKPGDKVFAYLGMKMGGNAEYACVPENGMIALKPDNLTYAQAATLPYGAVMALGLLPKANIQPGQKVLVLGASGGIGAMIVQLAKHYGAEVTGVCGTPRADYVKSLGADKVIDYAREDFTRSGETYDLIIDVLGRGNFDAAKNVLKPDGIYLYVSFKAKPLFQMAWSSLTRSRQRVICALAEEKADSLEVVRQLVEAGKIRAFVDKAFPLEQTAEAHRYAEAGDKKGNIVIVVNAEEN